jgi:hypothetical protein
LKMVRDRVSSEKSIWRSFPDHRRDFLSRALVPKWRENLAWELKTFCLN